MAGAETVANESLTTVLTPHLMPTLNFWHASYLGNE
jgi:hypothetical protein